MLISLATNEAAMSLESLLLHDLVLYIINRLSDFSRNGTVDFTAVLQDDLVIYGRVHYPFNIIFIKHE